MKKYDINGATWKRQYERMKKQADRLREAESLAFDFGYDTNYCDGRGLSDKKEQEYKARISALVGPVWPASVNKEYNRGLELGYWES